MDRPNTFQDFPSKTSTQPRQVLALTGHPNQPPASPLGTLQYCSLGRSTRCNTWQENGWTQLHPTAHLLALARRVGRKTGTPTYGKRPVPGSRSGAFRPRENPEPHHVPRANHRANATRPPQSSSHPGTGSRGTTPSASGAGTRGADGHHQHRPPNQTKPAFFSPFLPPSITVTFVHTRFQALPPTPALANQGTRYITSGLAAQGRLPQHIRPN